jgi:hypothetical protein
VPEILCVCSKYELAYIEADAVVGVGACGMLEVMMVAVTLHCMAVFLLLDSIYSLY